MNGNGKGNEFLVLVISLDRYKGRMSAISDQLRNAGINYSRVSAIRGENISLLDKSLINTRDYKLKHGKLPSQGELGCYLSHHRCMARLLASDHEYALILEDDAILGTTFLASLDAALKATCHWDVLRLQGFHARPAITIKTITTLGYSFKVQAHFKPSGCSVAYLINRKAAAAYKHKLLPMTLPYDHEFILGWKYGLKFRSLTPYSVQHPKTESTIRRGDKMGGVFRAFCIIYRTYVQIYLALYCLWEVMHLVGHPENSSTCDALVARD